MSKPAPQPASDIASLTARLARGDEEAFFAFHAIYFARLWRYLLVVTRGREDAAREALQLTLVRLARHVRRFDSEEVFWSWLTVLARSAVVDEARKSHRYANLLEKFSQGQPAQEGDSDRETTAQLMACLEESLTQLPAEDRALVERKYLAEGSVREIAEELQTTEKAVESRLVRVRRKLKEILLARLSDEKP